MKNPKMLLFKICFYFYYLIKNLIKLPFHWVGNLNIKGKLLLTSISFLFIFLTNNSFDVQKISYDYELKPAVTFNELDERGQAAYAPLYIGEKKKHVKLEYFADLEHFLDFEWKEHTYIDNVPIKIFVDTTQLIEDKSNDFYYFDEGENIEESVGKAAFPVVIVNENNKDVNIGFGNYVHLTLEAKDPYGQWLPIQGHYIYFCGVGKYDIILPADNMMITSVPVYKGNFKTQLRLQLGKSYSNEFDGYINLSQFNPVRY